MIPSSLATVTQCHPGDILVVAVEERDVPDEISPEKFPPR